MSIFSSSILFVFGLIVGSFLNVATLRYDPDKGFSNVRSWGGRSHCPHCRTQLAWYELVPVFSFLFLGGKCLHCKRNISFQYPIVELLTALFFVAVPLRMPAILQSLSMVGGMTTGGASVVFSALWVVIFILFLVLSVIDFRHMIIPDAIVSVLAFAGIALSVVTERFGGFDALRGSFLGHYALLFGLRDTIWLNHFFAALIGIVFFGCIVGFSRGRAMGWGDVKLAGALGIIFGWPDILLLLALSFIVGALVSVGLMMRGRKTMRDAVPFGPFLVIGATLVFFCGFQIVSAYFGLFGSF